MKRSLVFMVCVASLVGAASCSRPTTASRSSSVHAQADFAMPAAAHSVAREPLVSNGVEGGREHAWADDD